MNATDLGYPIGVPAPLQLPDEGTARVRRLGNALRATQSAALAGFEDLLRRRIACTGCSQARLRGFAGRVAADLGMDETDQEEVEIAAMLRDVGLVGLPDDVLARRRSLAPAEAEIVKSHPQLGSDLLRRFPGLDAPALYVARHHERLDGTGYPAGVGGDAIPLGARVIAVLDRLEALLRSQPGRPPQPFRLAAERLESESPGRFDPEVVARFTALLR